MKILYICLALFLASNLNARSNPITQQIAAQNAALKNHPLSQAERRDMIETIRKLRRVHGNLGSRVIVVNIAAAMLYVYEGGEQLFQSRIVVGDEYSKTPEWVAVMDSVTFRPPWKVPMSIARNEIAPEGPGYWAKYGFVPTGKGGFVQKPGSENALGLVAISFKNNKYSVLMHDTPYKEDFRDDYRAIGHGCTRVEKIVQLISYLKGWSTGQVRAYMNGYETKKFPMPGVKVVFIYAKSWVDPDGTLRFFSGYDGKPADYYEDDDSEEEDNGNNYDYKESYHNYAGEREEGRQVVAFAW